MSNQRNVRYTPKNSSDSVGSIHSAQSNSTAGSSQQAYTGTPQAKFKKLDHQGPQITLNKADPVLLTDDQVKEFLFNGYLVLKPNLPASFHAFIRKECEDFKSLEVDPDGLGNNILPKLPALQQVYEHPIVRGAVQSLLGPGYEMHPHRHAHASPPGKTPQPWHRDSFWGHRKPVRFPHPEYCMAMYYPQTVRQVNGPTEGKIGSHFYCMDPKNYKGQLDNKHKRNDKDVDCSFLVEEGSVVLIHYDIVHRAGHNKSEMNRMMFKFQFVRMEVPTKPSWNCTSPNWSMPTGAAIKVPASLKHSMEPVCQAVWNWMAGNTSVSPTKLDAQTRSSLIGGLDDKLEATRFYSAFSLALAGDTASLISRLTISEDQMKLVACLALSSITHTATRERLVEEVIAFCQKLNDWRVLSPALYILGEIGSTSKDEQVVKFLIPYLKHSDVAVRLVALEALGFLGAKTSPESTKAILDAIVPLMDTKVEADDQIRWTVALSLARMGPNAAPALQALCQSLNDYNRYLQGYAVIAIKRINTPEAQRLLIEFLMVSRWCPITNKASNY